MIEGEVQSIVKAIDGLRTDIGEQHKESLRRLDKSDLRQDKLEDTLNVLSKHMSTLATSMARLEEVQERMEKDNERQREVDEKQNQKLEELKEKFHEADKRLSALNGVPEDLKELRYRLKDNENRTEGLNEAHGGLFESIREIEKTLKGIERGQGATEMKLNSMEGWGKWFKERLLPTLVIAGVPAAVTYWMMSVDK